MEFTKVIESRRTVRAYEPGKAVDQAQLEELLYAAQQAPSWKNTETARYYVVSTPEMLEAVKENCLPSFNRKRCADAPVLIVTTFEKKISGHDNEGNPSNELGDEWGAYDLGLQNAYLILKARDMGLDTLIMGLRHGDKLRSLLQIPETQQIAAVIALGYGAEEPQKPKRKEIGEIAGFY